MICEPCQRGDHADCHELGSPGEEWCLCGCNPEWIRHLQGLAHKHGLRLEWPCGTGEGSTLHQNAGSAGAVREPPAWRGAVPEGHEGGKNG